jgi:hypothetical protein
VSGSDRAGSPDIILVWPAGREIRDPPEVAGYAVRPLMAFRILEQLLPPFAAGEWEISAPVGF